MYGKQSDVEFIEKYYNETSNPNLKRKLMGALVSIKNHDVLLRFILI